MFFFPLHFYRLVNIGSTSTGGKVLAMKKDMCKLALMQPVCTQQGEKIALSRRVDKHWRLIGWGQINRGVQIDCKTDWKEKNWCDLLDTDNKNYEDWSYM